MHITLLCWAAFKQHAVSLRYSHGCLQQVLGKHWLRGSAAHTHNNQRWALGKNSGAHTQRRRANGYSSTLPPSVGINRKKKRRKGKKKTKRKKKKECPAGTRVTLQLKKRTPVKRKESHSTAPSTIFNVNCSEGMAAVTPPGPTDPLPRPPRPGPYPRPHLAAGRRRGRGHWRLVTGSTVAARAPAPARCLRRAALRRFTAYLQRGRRRSRTDEWREADRERRAAPGANYAKRRRLAQRVHAGTRALPAAGGARRAAARAGVEWGGRRSERAPPQRHHVTGDREE